MKKMDELLVENDRLRILARHDSLTGLFNRGAMEEEIGALLRNKKGGVFLMLDVDHFKDINDVYGHLTGDLVLQELSRIMGYLFFKKDIIGRMGGDEFAIFIPGGYRNELVDSKVERLHSRAAQAGKDMGIGNSLKLTVGADWPGKTIHSTHCTGGPTWPSGLENSGGKSPCISMNPPWRTAARIQPQGTECRQRPMI